MLILTHDNKPLIAPGDITTEAADEMIEKGEAMKVTRLRVNRDITICAPDESFSFEASHNPHMPAIARVPEDIPERWAKFLVEEKYATRRMYATPHVEVLRN